MENLFFTVLGTVLGWIPPTYLWLRDRFTSTGAPGITFVVRHTRPADAKFKCKIRIEITNKLRGPVRLMSAYFVFDKGGPVKSDPLWSGEHGTGYFHLTFFNSATNIHDLPDFYLRPDEKTDVWVGVDPQLADQHIREGAATKNIGRLYFQMTRWTDSGNPKTRWVRVKL